MYYTGKVSCKSSEFLCDDGTHCINNIHVCDGVRDCVDGTDEKHCRKFNNFSSLSLV